MSIAASIHSDSPIPRQRRWAWIAVLVVLPALIFGVVKWRTAKVSNSITIEFSQAWEHLESGRLEEAENALRSLMRHPNQGDAYLILDAALCLAYKDFEAAERRIQVASTKGAMRPYALEVLGRSFYGRQRWYDAERAFATLAHEDPRSFIAHFWLGVIYDDLNMFGQAVHEARLASEIQPNDARPCLLRASIYFRFGRFHAAAEEYQQATRLASANATTRESPVAWTTSLVKCLVQDGQFDTALETIASVSEPSTELRALRAESFLGLGQLTEAERECRSILEEDENQLAVAVTLAKVGMQQTITEEHVRLLEEVFVKNDKDSEVVFLLSQVHGRLGNQQRQRELLILLEQLKKMQIRINELMGDVWSQTEDVESRLELAKIYEELGNPTQAKRWQLAADGCRQRIKALHQNSP